jgi:hypothetical protein
MDQLWSALYAFELALFGTLPLLVVALVGLILTWRRLARTHRNAFLWSLAGFVLLGAQSLAGPLANAIMAGALAPAAPGGDRIGVALSSALWGGLAANWLLIAAVACLLKGLLANRTAQDGPLEPSTK